MLNLDAPLLSGDALHERFLALDAFLLKQQSVWRENPFTQQRLSWAADYPELAAWLAARSLADAENYQAEPSALGAPQPFVSWAQQAVQLSAIGRFNQAALSERPQRMRSGIAQRKWQQIQAFSSAVHSGTEQSFARTQSWLDWCAGKGHLGRYLAWPDAQLQCLEFNPELISSGHAVSQK